MSAEQTDGIDAMDMQYIKRVTGDGCGLMSSRFNYLRNIHPSYTIIATVEEKTNLDTGPHSRTFDVELPPNPSTDLETPHPTDAYLGCPIPGPTLQMFEWKVLRARLK